MASITRDADTMHAEFVFPATRVPVETPSDYLEGGETLDDFLEGSPAVSRELAIAALEKARLLLLARALNKGTFGRVHRSALSVPVART